MSFPDPTPREATCGQSKLASQSTCPFHHSSFSGTLVWSKKHSSGLDLWKHGHLYFYSFYLSWTPFTPRPQPLPPRRSESLVLHTVQDVGTSSRLTCDLQPVAIWQDPRRKRNLYSKLWLIVPALFCTSLLHELWACSRQDTAWVKVRC